MRFDTQAKLCLKRSPEFSLECWMSVITNQSEIASFQANLVFISAVLSHIFVDLNSTKPTNLNQIEAPTRPVYVTTLVYATSRVHQAVNKQHCTHLIRNKLENAVCQ